MNGDSYRPIKNRDLAESRSRAKAAMRESARERINRQKTNQKTK